MCLKPKTNTNNMNLVVIMKTEQVTLFNFSNKTDDFVGNDTNNNTNKTGGSMVKTSKKLCDEYYEAKTSGFDDSDIVEAVDFMVEVATPSGKEFVSQAILKKCLSYKNLTQAFNYYKRFMTVEQIEEFKEFYL